MTVTGALATLPLPAEILDKYPFCLSGSSACTTAGQVLSPSVFTSTNRYSVCPAVVSKTPFLVGVLRKGVEGFWRSSTERMGLT